MSFQRTPEAYQRFMGVFAEPLAARFVALLDPRPGERALDVGCGTGILSERLTGVLGVQAVRAVDPSEPLVAGARARVPGLDVRLGTAEQLPWDDDSFDLAGAQLVVHFMTDPVAGLAEMLRVTRPGGRVAACVWDHASGGTPLSAFWRGAHAVDPDAQDESRLAGSSDGELAELLRAAGGRDVRSGALAVQVVHPTFEDWWEPYTLGIGPAGDYVAGLDDERLAAVRESCRREVGPGPVTTDASAWWALAHA